MHKREGQSPFPPSQICMLAVPEHRPPYTPPSSDQEGGQDARNPPNLSETLGLSAKLSHCETGPSARQVGRASQPVAPSETYPYCSINCKEKQ